MNIHLILELVGYAGSLLIVISMLMTSVLKLRIINSAGCLVFMIYALCIKTYPTAVMQLALLVINFFNIRRLFLSKKNYTVIKAKSDDACLLYFIKNYCDDMKKYFPAINFANDDVYLIFSADVPAGILIASENSQKEMNVKIDYATPAYRDCSVGRFIHNYLKEQGIVKMQTQSLIPEHQKYLKKMGFEEKNGFFEKVL
mgnify:CR=1 FL=1